MSVVVLQPGVELAEVDLPGIDLERMTDDELREFCRKASPDNGRTDWARWNRPMLLALCHNRGIRSTLTMVAITGGTYA